MLNKLFENPELLAHWIILLPFLAFVFITLKLTVNKNVDRKAEKPKKPKDELTLEPAWKSYLPVLIVVPVLIILGVIFKDLGSGNIDGGAPAQSGFNVWSLWPYIVLAIGVFAFPFNSRQWVQKYGKYISVGAVAISAVIATSLFIKFITKGAPGAEGVDPGTWLAPFHFTWFEFGNWNVDIGVKIDGFAVFGAWMVTVVAMCIQWFSVGYMWDDDYGRRHNGRYFAQHSLFVTGMLGVVLSDNILTFLIGWEVMGLCSYLLIGFFTHKPSANAAQVKAFITTRIGDVGFMLGIFLLGLMFTYAKLPPVFSFNEIRDVVTTYDWNAVNLGWMPTAAALLIFLGAVGKSAQFPLHVWLPDAMEGPTPVSALIHAATMVAAGVFLVARFFWLFEMSPTAMLTVAWIGAITAFGAATIGVVQYDIKRILAYSTLSQLGYMMIGLGVGSATAGVFHLLTHAYFKALLFLGSGAVIYGCRHIQDIRYMGGLRKKMPITFYTFMAGTLALAGIAPFAGFWSKDEILGSVFKFAQEGHTRFVEVGGSELAVRVIDPHWTFYIIFLLGIAGAFLTAFYMFRLIAYTFLGDKFRAKESPDYGHHAKGEADTPIYDRWETPEGPFDEYEHHHGPAEPKEVPPSMWIPLVILGVFATLYGLIGMPFLGGNNIIANNLHHGHIHEIHVDTQLIILMLFSLAVAVLGVIAGLYINNTERGRALKEQWKAKFPGFYRTVYNKYYIDEFYEEFIIQPVLFLCQAARVFDTYIVDGIVNAAGWLSYQFARFQGWWDNAVVDGIVNGVAKVTRFFSDFTKPIQSGYVQNYMMVIIIFVLFYLLTIFIR